MTRQLQLTTSTTPSPRISHLLHRWWQRTRRPVLTALLLLVALVSTTHAAEADAGHRRKRIAVVDFGVPAALYNACGDAGRAGAGRLGSVLVDMFTQALVASRSFDVIERAQLDKVLSEQGLDKQQLLDPATAPQAGKILGVDYLLGGTLSEFGMKKKSVGLGGWVPFVGGALDISKSTARAAVDLRLIDTTTATVLFAAKGEGENSEMGIGFGAANWWNWMAKLDFSTSEWTSSRIGRATRQAVDRGVGALAAKFPAEARVLVQLPDGSVIIDMGALAGLAVGTQFELFNETIIRGDKGEIVWREQKSLGLVKVTEVQPERSKLAADKALGAGTVKSGDCARLKVGAPAK